MRKKSNFQFAKALYEVTKDLPKSNLPEVIGQFVLILQKNNKLKKVNYIIEEFENYAKKQEGIKMVEIETARKLDPTVISKLKKTFGEKSEITELVNKELLGGARIKVDDMVYDASLKTQLARLKQALI
ncbi:MAG: ATP synthase subunit delta [Candidatus Magasanikbacteria bacterium GW2011_GWA2_40_10]|uniref:ATP synthase subunit delta n=1 Tax=Candidatus Magasanikbacteria bacterium GW2011_GWA2_40_10 TaxID=1619037 RepID=A0A0G0QBC4_9BACT|nr:MAG: ATP synthase subunit delta [Candidatus Magasanikbacteria bacterium GW2011_GWA2_40_10]